MFELLAEVEELSDGLAVFDIAQPYPSVVAQLLPVTL